MDRLQELALLHSTHSLRQNSGNLDRRNSIQEMDFFSENRPSTTTTAPAPHLVKMDPLKRIHPHVNVSEWNLTILVPFHVNLIRVMVLWSVCVEFLTYNLLKHQRQGHEYGRCTNFTHKKWNIKYNRTWYITQVFQHHNFEGSRISVISLLIIFFFFFLRRQDCSLLVGILEVGFHWWRRTPRIRWVFMDLVEVYVGGWCFFRYRYMWLIWFFFLLLLYMSCRWFHFKLK